MGGGILDFVKPVVAREVDKPERGKIVFAKLPRERFRNMVPPLNAVFLAFKFDVPGTFFEKKAEDFENLNFVGTGVTFGKLVRAKALHIKKHYNNSLQFSQ